MDLQEIRKSIDRLDAQIVGLLQRRMKYALLAGRNKKAVCDPQREERLMKNLLAKESAVLDAQFIKEVYELIIAKSRQLQEHKKTLVGFQGEHGTWSEIAIHELGRDMVPIPYSGLREVFCGVRKKEVDFGILPTDSSFTESVAGLPAAADLNIAGEVVIPIHHNLLSLPGCKPRSIRTVYSHPHALAQCSAFLSRNKLEPHPFYDTAGAALWLSSEGQRSAGVIASSQAAEIYNLEIVKEHIDDHPETTRRFILLSQGERTSEGSKCSIACSVEHRAGALFDVLRIFKEQTINLTRIESSPEGRNAGAYGFILEFQGSPADPSVGNLIKSLQESHIEFTFVRRYHGAAQ
jgi:prephenate dehydratase/chorismate mutase